MSPEAGRGGQVPPPPPLPESLLCLKDHVFARWMPLRLADMPFAQHRLKVACEAGLVAAVWTNPVDVVIAVLALPIHEHILAVAGPAHASTARGDRRDLRHPPARRVDRPKDLDQFGHSDDRRIEPSCMRHGNEAKQCRNDQWLASHAVSFVHSRQRRDRRRRMPGAQEAALRTGLPQVCQCGCGPPRPGSQAGQEVGLAGFWVHAFDQDRFVPTAMPPSAAARLERPLVRRAPSEPIPGESGQDEAQCTCEVRDSALRSPHRSVDRKHPRSHP